MIKDVTLSYMATFLASFAGYAMVGGSFWMWCLTAWLVGAPVTLMAIWAKLKLQELSKNTQAAGFGWNVLGGYGFFQTTENRNR